MSKSKKVKVELDSGDLMFIWSVLKQYGKSPSMDAEDREDINKLASKFYLL